MIRVCLAKHIISLMESGKVTLKKTCTSNVIMENRMHLDRIGGSNRGGEGAEVDANESKRHRWMCHSQLRR